MEENKFPFVVVMLFVLSIIAFGFSLYLKKDVIVDKGSIMTSLVIEEISGFDLNTSVLTFGSVAPGNGASRKMTIENDYGFPIVVEFYVEGDLKEFVSYERFIYLQPGEVKKVEFRADTFENDSYDELWGEIKYMVKKDI